MHVIYDNLLAVLISGFLLTVLMQLSIDSNETRVDSTRYYANRVQSTAFIETMQRDFRNIGAGVDAAQTMVVSFSWTSFPRSLEFKAALATTPSPPVEEIKYEIDVVPSSQSTCGNVTCYEIKRYRKDGGTYVYDGGSQATITKFDIKLKDGDDLEVGSGNLDDTRKIEVSLTALSPFGDNDLMKHTRWQSRLQPVNLLRKDD